MEYDPELNLWSTISTYPGERNGYSHFTVFGDRFFKIGGANYWERFMTFGNTILQQKFGLKGKILNLAFLSYKFCT